VAGAAASGREPQEADGSEARGAELTAAESRYLASLAPPAPSAYHRLNPLTKAVAAATV